jgi:phage portal protein BeeE
MPLKKDERERLEKQYQKDYGIRDEQSSVMITDSSLSWTPMTYPTKDLMLFEEVDKNMMTIVDAYGLDVNMFSSEKGTTFSNLYEGIKGAYENTIIPHAKTIANAFGEFLEIKENEQLELSFDHLPIMQKDKTKEAEILQKKADAYSKFKSQGMSDIDLALIFPIDELIDFL